MNDEQDFRSSVALAESSIAEIQSKPTSRLLWPGTTLKWGIRRVLRFVLGPQLRFNRAVHDALEIVGRTFVSKTGDHADQLRRIEALIGKLTEQGRYLTVRVDEVERLARQHGEQFRGLDEIQNQSVAAADGFRTSIQNLERFSGELMQDLSSDLAEIRAVQGSLGRQIDEVGGELVANTIDVKRIGKSHAALEETSSRRIQTLEDRFEPLMDLDHFEFARAYRGDEVAIQARLEGYARSFGSVKRVLDFGCGRGEFLKVCSGLSIGAYGVDRDSDMISHCNLQGLDVLEQDALEHLSELPARSLDGIFSSQVVEHMTPAEIVQMIKLASDKLKRGGKIIIETINPNTWSAMRWFYLDPSHSQPVPADMLRFFLRDAKFEVLDTLYTSYVPEDERLSFMKIGTPIEESMLTSFLEVTNENIQRLNDLLFGPQDYAIIAER